MNGFIKIVPALALASAALTLAGCDQPKIQCTSAHGEFAVKLTLRSGSGTCAMLKGGEFGVQSYSKGMPGARPAFQKPPVAIRANQFGELVAKYQAMMVDEHQLSSKGEFEDLEPGADGFCRVGQLSPATLMLSAKPASVDAMGMTKPALPAMAVTYEWSDVRFYVSAALPGTQFSGKLKYSENGCTAEYDAVGLTPTEGWTKGCELKMEVTGPDGKTMTMATGMPDDTLCSPCADVKKGRSQGSGISPIVDAVCDPGILLCVPRKPPPSLLATPIMCGAQMPPTMTSAGT